MKILLYEHVSSGGFANETLPASLLSEGFAMLRGLTADFKAIGQHVTVMLDSRIAVFHPPLEADRLIQVSSEDTFEALTNASKDVETAFVIAPEPNNVLSSIVKHIETLNLFSLNCRSDAINLAADKASLYERVKCLGLHAPETFLFNCVEVKKILQVCNDLGFPVVVKPLNGAGCSGLSVAKNEMEVAAAVDKIKTEAPKMQVLIQKLIKGIPASVSLISNGFKALPVSLNKQDVTLASPDSFSSYNGGVVPLNHPLNTKAFDSAKKVVESFEGLRGYVGVDIILTADEVFIIEVNPRLTTSYVGLRKVAKFNFAQFVLNACLKNEIPQITICKGYSYFLKVPVKAPFSAGWKETYKMPEFVSPPFPIAGDNVNYAIVETDAENEAKALVKFSEAKERLQCICQGGK